MMLTALFLVWLQMSAQPQIKIGEIRPMHHRCQVWMGGGWITLQADMGALLCEEKDGQLVVIGSPDEVQAKDSEVLSWTSANTTEKFFDEAAQRAADETDGKLPPCKIDDGTPCEYKAYVGRIPDPVDVPAVQVDYIARPKGQFFSCGLNLCKAEQDIIEQRPGCADKSRILEHDENSPPKYWCRKVQP